MHFWLNEIFSLWWFYQDKTPSKVEDDLYLLSLIFSPCPNFIFMTLLKRILIFSMIFNFFLKLLRNQSLIAYICNLCLNFCLPFDCVCHIFKCMQVWGFYIIKSISFSEMLPNFLSESLSHINIGLSFLLIRLWVHLTFTSKPFEICFSDWVEVQI